ncbi:MAG: response regulator [Acidimicrobiales bacterium]
MAAIWETSRGLFAESLKVIEDAVGALLQGGLSSEDRRRAEREAHKLGGSLGTFGFQDASRQAQEIEWALQGTGPVEDQKVLALSERVMSLLHTVDQPLPEVSATPGAQSTGVEVGTAGEIGGEGRILVVGADGEYAHRVIEQAVSHGINGRTVDTLDAALSVMEDLDPHVVVLDMEDDASSATVLPLIRAVSSSERPAAILIIAAGLSIDDRVQLAQAGVERIIRKPVPPRMVIDLVRRLIEKDEDRGVSVLAVDDDDTALAVLRTVLGGGGFRVEALNGGEGFWTELERVRPDLVILDFDMPHLDGPGLCRALRSEERWAALPVMFVTSRRDPASVREMFAAGADDHLVKPLDPQDLMVRVESRLARTRMVGRLANDGPGSGLLNRQAFVDALERLVGFAHRYDKPLSVAAMQMDPRRRPATDERSSDDGAGYGADRADLLRHLVRRSVPREDPVGSWDDDQVLVGIFDASPGDAADHIARIVETVRDETAAGVGAARTASAGLVHLPSGGSDASGLIATALASLKQAQSRGGDRVDSSSHEPAAPGGDVLDVMLVDDDEALGALLVHALQTRGLRTGWIRDGVEAYELLGSGTTRPRVLLLDVGLPALDGLSLLRQIRQRGLLDQMRVIMVTLRSTESEVLEAMELGAFDHVAKPLSIPVLLHRVRRALDSLPR